MTGEIIRDLVFLYTLTCCLAHIGRYMRRSYAIAANKLEEMRDRVKRLQNYMIARLRRGLARRTRLQNYVVQLPQD